MPNKTILEKATDFYNREKEYFPFVDLRTCLELYFFHQLKMNKVEAFNLSLKIYNQMESE